MLSRAGYATALVVLVLLAAATVALAASPRKGGHYLDRKHQVDVIVSADGKSALVGAGCPKTGGFYSATSHPTIAHGKFKYSGPAFNGSTIGGTLTIIGTFKNQSEIDGTATAPGCHKTKFKAKLK